MNRFRTKKKNKESKENKEEAAAAAAAASASSFTISHTNTNLTRPSTDDGHGFMGFRRSKKTVEEAKEEEIDLSSALPDTNDFRTSLLMTGLSARFSMLREQDDPTTKIGKALDDSVLFGGAGGSTTSTAAKRQSRMMMDFGGLRGLDDIAEVESIRAMRAPPFLRTHSFASDTDSVGDSIMSRTRPTDGNNLFGGRQKIYRIPAGAASAKSIADGGMGGRALYDDDVALSAFQKLRQEKKDQLLQYGYASDDNTAAEAGGGRALLVSGDAFDNASPYPRSESPSPVDYNLRRETSSTTSSGGARNSTAATSVASQPASSLGKEWQSPLLDGKAGSDKTDRDSIAPGERNTTTMRIRRLYEQGLHQDMHENQNSALSRIDTLSGKRMLRSRTPDLSTSASPSPTLSFGFKDALGVRSSSGNLTGNLTGSNTTGTVTSTLERLERRQVLTRSSTTNLRSMSPTMGASLPGTISARTSSEGLSSLNMMGGGVGLGLNRKTSGASGVSRAGSVAGSAGITSPPLTPCISESGISGTGIEVSGLLPIQPNDIGKATAMGMFQKPTLPYDESRFAERQLMLQQGRAETPTETERERDPEPEPPRPDSKLQQSFLFDGDDEDDDNDNESAFGDAQSQTSAAAPQRPSDADHPAFRQPSPAVIQEENEPEAAEAAAVSSPTTATIPTTTVTVMEADDRDGPTMAGQPVDSPTLGPGGGLSGMVLQHLRTVSNASSVYSMASPQHNGYDIPTHTNHLNFAFGDSTSGGAAGGGLDLDLSLGNRWDDGNNWTTSIYSAISTSETVVSDSKTTAAAPAVSPTPSEAPPTPRASTALSASTHTHTDSAIPGENEEDDFASQLASARRRVQERLTTYAESEGSRSNSPQLGAAEPEPALPQSSSAKPTPLTLLRAKSSRGSLLDRAREAAPPMRSPSTSKKLGLGASTMSTAPSPARPSFERPSLEQFDERSPVEAPLKSSSNAVPRTSTSAEDFAEDDDEDRSAPDGSSNGGSAMHPGLMAFRNARRQLQRDASATPPPMSQASSPVQSRSPPPRQRRPTVSKPPPVSYDAVREGRSSSSNGMRSRSGSRTGAATPDGRDRSGSETSNNGYSRHAAPPRIRTTPSQPSSPVSASPGGGGALPGRPGMIPARSPGLPGTDIRRSPHMPPQSYAKAAPAAMASGNNLSVQTAMGGRSPSTQPSPISPLSGGGAASFLQGGERAAPTRAAPATPTGIPRMVQPASQQQRPGNTGYSTTSSSLHESMKRTVRKAEISEPTFVMSTSRVPTMSLAAAETDAAASSGSGSGSGSSSSGRARSNSRTTPASTFVPPLPPINPLRKASGVRTPRNILNGFRRTATDDHKGSSSTDDSEGLSSSAGDADGRPALRKQASEASGMHSRLTQQRKKLPGGLI